MSWLILLMATLSCTVGEVPPEGPSMPAEETRPEAPGGVPGEPGDAGVGVEREADALLGQATRAYEAGEVGDAYALAGRVLGEHPRTSSAVRARWVAARAAFALERYEEARELAESYASSQPSGSEERAEARRLAELAADALVPATNTAAVIGAVLPRSGSRVLVRYGDMLLEGIELAVAEAERLQGRPLQLVVADDGGGARTREAVAELERQGAVGIVGPLLPQQLAEAAGARSNARLVLVSPTVPEAPSYWPQLYSVSGSDARGAEALGRYAADAGLRQAAVLYLGTADYRRKAQAFAAEFEARGGRVRVSVPYDSGTTTFDRHMEQVLAAAGRATAAGEVLGQPAQGDTLPGAATEPFALYVAAPDRDVPQIAPQVSFYGLDAAGVQLLGDEAWAGAGVRRLVPARDLEGVIASSYFPPERSEGVSDPEFVRLYEARYRRSLTNPLPALGYDAANLVLQALPSRRLTPDALAQRFGLLAGIRGATGLLSVRAERIVRTPYLVQIRDGKLVPAPQPWEYQLPVPRPASGESGSRGGR